MTDITHKDFEKGASLWRDAWLRLRKNRLAMASLVYLVFIFVVCSVGPGLTPYGYDEPSDIFQAEAPDAQHWFGTDILGRDLFTRILYGGRISLAVGFAATGVALLIGVFYGAIAGFASGRTDSIMMRLVDILYTMPFTMVVIILMVYLGQSLLLIFLAIGAVEWLTMARIVRSQVLSLKHKEFVEAAEVMAIPRSRILVRHVIPNALGPIIVYATLTVPSVMLLEAFVSFLGLGVQRPMSSWGLLISDGVETMEEYPWLLLFPSLVFSTTLFALNFLGDGLRDALDPRISKD